MERLLKLRKEFNLSQAELADMLHISQQAICKYELGQSEPDIYTLKGMADIFHTSVDYLIGYSGDVTDYSDRSALIDNKPISRLEINHLIAYRKLTDSCKKNIDSIISEINKR